MIPRRLLPVLLLTTALVAAAAPTATAQTAQSTVLLHDLVEDGQYTACHVTTEAFATYRLTVQAGQHVILTVRGFDNNTQTHTLSVDGVSGESGSVAPGGSATFEFDAPTDGGSYAVRCDGESNSYQGLLVVDASGATNNGDGDSATPGPGLLGALVAVAAGTACVAARGGRRG